jgi:predicted transcriptional regulator
MGGERPKWIDGLLNIFKKPPMVTEPYREIEGRFVKSTEIDIQTDGKVVVDELKVELSPDKPDDFARVIAQTFRTRRTTFGSYDKKTGKFDIKDVGE